MTLHLQEPTRVNEPRQADEFAQVISRVASEGQAVIVSRDGADVAAIIPMEQLDVLQEALAMQESQRLLKSMDLPRMAKENPPPQAWFERDEPKPF